MIIALWVILVLLLVWISLSELPAGWDGHAPLPYLIALSPFAWIGFTAIGIWAGCLREWPLMVCAIVGLIASLLRKTAYYMNDLRTPNTGELIARKLAEKREFENSTVSSNSAAVENLANGHFNVFTLNCRYGKANAHEIVNTVRTNDIAVLALQEMNHDLVTELHDAGLDDLLPFHQFGDPSSSDNGGFNGLWLRVEPTEQTPTGVPIPAADVPTVTLPVTSTFNITFASAHPKSPQRSCKDWSAGIIGLGALAKSANKGRDQNADDSCNNREIAVLMGDLNSSIVHPSFRKLLASGFHDAALVEARGEHPTYPSWLKWPRIVIDHILFTDFMAASNVRAVFIDGTDHLGLTATLTIRDTRTQANAAARESWPSSLPPLPAKSRQETAE